MSVRDCCVSPAVSIFPVAPLIVVAVSSLTGRFSTKVGATVLALASIAILPSVFVAATNAEDTEPEATLFVYDIIGIAVQTPDPPGFIRERIGVSFTAEQLQDCYNSKSVRPFLWHGKCTFDDRLWPKKEMWLRTIRQYPWEYLKHRFSHHGELFGRIDVQMDGWVDRPMFAEHNSPKSIGDLVFPPEINFSISGDGDNPILNAVLRHQRFIVRSALALPTSGPPWRSQRPWHGSRGVPFGTASS